jgi:hypothetical protein
MITTPSMGLKRWDQPNDVFSYTELSDNFAAIDVHDHSSGKGVQISTGGIANLAIDNTKLANSAVSGAKIAAATVADSNLASPNNGAWKTIFQANFRTGSTESAGTLYVPIAGSGQLIASGTTTTGGVPMLVFNPSHYSVAGKTLQLRLLIGCLVNNVAPAITITANLRVISSTVGSGGSGAINYTVGSAVSGSDVAFVSPAANASVQNSAIFTPPVAGNYALGAIVSGAPAANSGTNLTASIQYAHV